VASVSLQANDEKTTVTEFGAQAHEWPDYDPGQAFQFHKVINEPE
jgi:hypothetical protein